MCTLPTLYHLQTPIPPSTIRPHPIVFKVHLHPAFSTPRLLYDYKHANWPLFRSSIDLALDPHPTVQNTIELDHAIAAFTQTICQAATHAIPVHALRRNHLTLPPSQLYLWKLKNYYHRRYQRTLLPSTYHLYHLFTQVFSTHLTHLRNSKWSFFLNSLRPQTSQFWKIARYFAKSLLSIPPLIHQGGQVYLSAHKAEVLAQQFECSHHLTLNLGTPHHTVKITQFIDRFFQGTILHTPPLQLTNIYEIKHKLRSLKLRAAPGDDGITPLMLRNLSRKAFTHLTKLFNHLLQLGHFPTTWKRVTVIPIPKPNKPRTDPGS
jgi:hypothetical protein